MFLFLTMVVYLAVLFQEEGWFEVDPAILGLSLSMLLQLAGLFQWCIRQSAEVVNQMVSVERVISFGGLESEAALEKDTDRELAGAEWPKSGSVEFEGVSVRYRATLPLALNQATFSIPGGARVGIVGRTGSGKLQAPQTRFGNSASGANTMHLFSREINCCSDSVPLIGSRRGHSSR